MVHFLWNFLFIFLLAESAKLEEDTLPEDFLEYPIIVNADIDKAVFILPRKGCQVYSNRDGIESLLLKQSLNIYKEDGKTVDDIITLCELYQNETIDANQFLDGVRLRAILIYPGTKWCGLGSRASNESDLGYYIETDKCCREHDSCQDIVEGFTCHPTNGLCNLGPFTRSHCSCDEKFRQCLYKSNETVSRRIGTLYFTIFGFRCFRQDYPVIKCLDWGGFLNIHCQKYLLNYEEEPTFQFFDSPKYDLNARNESHVAVVGAEEESPHYEEENEQEHEKEKEDGNGTKMSELEWNHGTMQMSIPFQTTSSSLLKTK